MNVGYKRGVSGTQHMANQQFLNLHQVLTGECCTQSRPFRLSFDITATLFEKEATGLILSESFSRLKVER